MKEQEIFDTAVGGILRQKAKCVNEGVCSYRFEEKKCAAGFLIPDDLYKPIMEGFSLRRLILTGYFPEEHPQTAILKQHQGLISKLQHIHDCTYTYNFYQNVYTSYKSLAEELGLKWNFTYEEQTS